MKKRFKAKKKKKRFLLKLIFFCLIIYISFIFTMNYIKKNKIETAKLENLLYLGLNTSSLDLDFLNPVSLLMEGSSYKIELKENKETSDYKVIDISNNKRPLIYIYNTHQKESYSSSAYEPYNIDYTVQTASYILADYLRSYGIECFVENESISSYLANHNLKYNQSYEASKYYIEKRLKEYDSIKYIIDLHRDSSLNGAATYKDIETDKSYAKILFIVGLDNPNYEPNLLLANNVNALLPENISRGVLKKSGTNVNGIYNQNIIENSMLIEIGDETSTILEVDNTLSILAEKLFSYINGGN